MESPESLLVETSEANVRAVTEVNESSTEELIDTLSQLEEMNSETVSLQDTIRQLEESQRQLELKNLRTLAQVGDLEAEISALRAQNQSLVLVAEHSKDLAALNNDFRTQLELIGSTQVHSESLLSTVRENADESADLIRRLELEIESLRQELVDSSVAYEESLALKDSELAQYKGLIAELTQGDGSAAELEEASRQVTESKHQIARLEEDILRLSQSHKEMKEEYSRGILTLEVALAEQTAQLNELNGVKENLEAQISDLKNEASISTNKISLLKAELVKQTNQNKLLSKEQLEEILQTKSALESHKATVEELLEVNTRAVCEIDELKYSLQQVNNKLLERTESYDKEILLHRGQLGSLKEQLNEALKEKELLEERITSGNEISSRHSDNKIEELESTAAALQLQVNSLENTLATTVATLERSEIEGLSLRQELKDTNGSILLLEREIQRRENDLSSSECEVQLLRQQFASQTEDFLRMRSELDRYEQFVSQLNEEKEGLKSNLMDAKAEVSTYQEKVAQVSAEMTRQLTASKLVIKEKQEKILLLADAGKLAEAKAESLISEIAELTAKIATLEAERESTARAYQVSIFEALNRAKELESQLATQAITLREEECAKLESYHSIEELSSTNKRLIEELEVVRSEVETLRNNTHSDFRSQLSDLSSLREANQIMKDDIARTVKAKEDAERESLALSEEIQRNRERALVYEAEIRSLMQIQELAEKDLEHKLSIYSEECVGLRGTLEELQQRNDQLENALLLKEDDFRRKFEQKIQEHEEELMNLRSIIERDSVRLLDALEGKSVVENQLLATNEELSVLQLLNNNLKQEMATLKRHARRAIKSREGSLVLREEVDVLRRSVTEELSDEATVDQQLSRIHDVVTRDKEDLIVNLQATESAYRKIQAELDELKVEHEKLLSEHDQVVQEWRKQEEGIQHLEQLMILASVDYETKSAQYIAEIDNLQLEIKLSKTMVLDLTVEKNEMSSKLLKATSDLSSSVERVMALESEVADMTANYQQEVTFLTSRYETEMNKHREVSNEIATLQSTLENDAQRRIKAEKELLMANKELDSSRRLNVSYCFFAVNLI